MEQGVKTKETIAKFQLHFSFIPSRRKHSENHWN